MPEHAENREARKVFSRMGMALFVFLAVATVAQLVWFLIPQLIPGLGWLGEKSFWTWLGVGVPMYLIATPVSLLLFRTVPAAPPEKQEFGLKRFLVFVPVAFFITYAGNIIGTLLSSILSGGQAENAVSELAMENSLLKVLVMVILAPLMEELVFRKLLIDRVLPYGEKTAVLLSAITFAMFHQNLFQFFYAFGAGLLLAYLYVRSGKLRYPVLLHMIVNFMGSVVAPAVLSSMEQVQAVTEQALPPEEVLGQLAAIMPHFVVVMLYSMLLYGLLVSGLVLFIVKLRRLTWKETALQLEKKGRFKIVYGNVGTVLFTVLCVSMCVISLFA